MSHNQIDRDGVLWPYPADPQERAVYIKAERQFRKGFLESALQAAKLTPDGDDPYVDIYERLKLNRIWQQRRQVKESPSDASRLAYWRGRTHGLEYVQQAYYDTDFADRSEYNGWDYFHERLVKPWADEVKAWAEQPVDGRYILPPDLIYEAREIAKQEGIEPSPLPKIAVPACPSKSRIETIQLSDVEGKAIQWFWPNRIPAGMLSLLVGNPGVGKSFLTMYICAVVSTGRDWPDAANVLPPGSVLLFSDEESLEYAIKPRLDAHQADCTKIHAVPHIILPDGNPDSFTIDEHIQVLREHLASMPDCRLLIFDPITAYLGAVNANNNAEVRGALIGLQRLAQDSGVTVLGINHFSKKAELDAIHRILGSTGFVAAARSVWAVIQEKQDDDGDDEPPRLLIPVKTNYSVAPTTLRFHLTDGRVVFDEGQHRVDIDSILQKAKKTGGQRANKKDEIAGWLSGRIGSETVLADELQAEAEAKGFTWSYVQKVATEVGVVKSKSTEHGGKSVWACGSCA